MPYEPNKVSEKTLSSLVPSKPKNSHYAPTMAVPQVATKYELISLVYILKNWQLGLLWMNNFTLNKIVWFGEI